MGPWETGQAAPSPHHGLDYMERGNRCPGFCPRGHQADPASWTRGWAPTAGKAAAGRGLPHVLRGSLQLVPSAPATVPSPSAAPVTCPAPDSPLGLHTFGLGSPSAGNAWLICQLIVLASVLRPDTPVTVLCAGNLRLSEARRSLKSQGMEQAEPGGLAWLPPPSPPRSAGCQHGMGAQGQPSSGAPVSTSAACGITGMVTTC